MERFRSQSGAPNFVIRALRDRAAWLQQLRSEFRAGIFRARGFRLGSYGYADHKLRQLEQLSRDERILGCFRTGAPLPAGFGRGVDERAIEYPWVFARLPVGSGRVLDAGSTLNFGWVACLPGVASKQVTVFTLAPEGEITAPNYVFRYGDLRCSGLPEQSFDTVVCISTIEHIGMNNTLFYTHEAQYEEADPTAYRPAMRELHRLLAPGGRLLLTVPFGQRGSFGWLQQFDSEMLDDAIRCFGGALHSLEFFRCHASGWQRSTADESASAEYVWIRKGRHRRHVASSARAVACAELVRV